MTAREKTSDDGYEKRIQTEVFRDYFFMPLSSHHREYDDVLMRLGLGRKTRANFNTLYPMLCEVSNGLLAHDDQSRITHFFEELEKYNEGKSFDLPFVIESILDGAITFGALCEDANNQNQGDFAAEHKSAKAEKRNQCFIPCFQKIMEWDQEHNYRGKGQGSGRAKIWSSCETLRKQISEQTFKRKFKEWKAMQEQGDFSSEAQPCVLGGKYCGK